MRFASEVATDLGIIVACALFVGAAWNIWQCVIIATEWVQ